jgi:hypothetical protein
MWWRVLYTSAPPSRLCSQQLLLWRPLNEVDASGCAYLL